jgi:MSHA biogenesis protein MshP
MRNLQRQGGFSLVTAIFLLVVIAALGAFAVTISTSQHQSDAMDIMGKRAYQAAKAGIEWGAFQIIQSSVSPTFASACQTGSTSQTIALSDAPLNVFTVNVSCSTGAVSYNEDGVTRWSYELSASAVVGSVGSEGFAERVIGVTIVQ